MFDNKWKVSFFISIILLLTSNVFWLYTTIDQMISYSYLSDSYKGANDKNKELAKLIVKGADNYTQKDILHLLRQANPDSFIVEKKNEIFASYSIFRFENGKLISVE